MIYNRFMPKYLDIKKREGGKSSAALKEPSVTKKKADYSDDFVIVDNGPKPNKKRPWLAISLTSLLISGGGVFLYLFFSAPNLPHDPNKALQMILGRQEKLKAAKFTMSAVIDDKSLSGKPVDLNGLGVDTEGSIVFPDKIDTQSRYVANDPLSRTSFLKNFDFSTVVVGEKKYTKNYLEDYWREGVNAKELGQVNNPLDYIYFANFPKNVSRDMDALVDNVPCYKFNFEVDKEKLPKEIKNVLKSGSIKINLWVDKERLFVREERAIIEVPEPKKSINVLVRLNDLNNRDIKVEEPKDV